MSVLREYERKYVRSLLKSFKYEENEATLCHKYTIFFEKSVISLILERTRIFQLKPWSKTNLFEKLAVSAIIIFSTSQIKPTEYIITVIAIFSYVDFMIMPFSYMLFKYLHEEILYS